MPEKIVLDPSEVASGRTQLDITPWLNQEGIDWGDAQIEATMASQIRGATPVDFTVPNRMIAGGLVFNQAIGGTSTVAARAAIQKKLARIQEEGGWLKRITNSGGTVYADLVNAAFHATSVSGFESAASRDSDATFSLEAIPDFYGDEVTLSDHTETSAAELIFTEADIDGDYPCRVRVVVDEDDADDQRGLISCFRSKHYSAATTASMEYQAEELGTLDTATKVAGTSVYGTATNGLWSGGTIVHHGTVSTNWTPVLSTNLGGTQYLTHTGTYRMYARVASTSGTAVQLRSVWDVGDLVNPVENSPWTFPGASNAYIADLGEVRLDPTGIGTHRWQGQIQARGQAGNETASVDKLWLVNQDEGAGVLTAPLNIPNGLVTYSARDEFQQTSGTLTGKSLAVGGTWTAGHGDTDDYSINTSADTAERATTLDTATSLVTNGRTVTASTTSYSTVAARLDVKHNPLSTNLVSGLILRYVDGNNFLWAHFTSTSLVALKKIKSGVQTELASGSFQRNANEWYSIAAIALADGSVGLWAGRQGAESFIGASRDTDFATGGTLASGKVGLFDGNASTDASTRSYDNFAVWVPASDAVAFASQSVQLTTDGIVREDSGGTAYGPVSNVRGDLPRIPPTNDGRTTEVFIKASRGDLDQLPDSGIDDISARVTYRPSWLFVPDS